MNSEARLDQHERVLAAIEKNLAAVAASQRRAEQRAVLADQRADRADQRADRADQRMDRFEKRMKRFDERIERLDKKTEKRFQSQMRVIIGLAQTTHENTEVLRQVVRRLDRVEHTLARLVDFQLRSNGRPRRQNLN